MKLENAEREEKHLNINKKMMMVINIHYVDSKLFNNSNRDQKTVD